MSALPDALCTESRVNLQHWDRRCPGQESKSTAALKWALPLLCERTRVVSLATVGPRQRRRTGRRLRSLFAAALTPLWHDCAAELPPKDAPASQRQRRGVALAIVWPAPAPPLWKETAALS